MGLAPDHDNYIISIICLVEHHIPDYGHCCYQLVIEQ